MKVRVKTLLMIRDRRGDNNPPEELVLIKTVPTLQPVHRHVGCVDSGMSIR